MEEVVVVVMVVVVVVEVEEGEEEEKDKVNETPPTHTRNKLSIRPNPKVYL